MRLLGVPTGMSKLENSRTVRGVFTSNGVACDRGVPMVDERGVLKLLERGDPKPCVARRLVQLDTQRYRCSTHRKKSSKHAA